MSFSCDCCVLLRTGPLRRADHSYRGVVQSIVCLSVTEEPHRGDLGPIGLSSHEEKVSLYDFKYIESRATSSHG